MINHLPSLLSEAQRRGTRLLAFLACLQREALTLRGRGLHTDGELSKLVARECRGDATVTTFAHAIVGSVSGTAAPV